MANNTYIDQFRAAMQQRGLTPPAHIIADGKMRRFDSNGGGKKNGWYVLHDGTVPSGVFGDWALSIKERWQADIGRELTAEEQAALKEELAALRKEQEAEEQAQQAEAKADAERILALAKEADDNHPYLVKKEAKAYGVFVYNKKLVVPMRDAAGDLHSLQYIKPDGGKQFKSGGRVKGCLHLIGEPQDVLCIAEGYATGATIYEATGYAVAVAFNAGNLAAVAKAMREKYPDAIIVLCADDDYKTENNPGLTKAKAAAQEVGGLLALPTFGKERAEKATDFNDMAAASDLDSVKAAIAATLASGAVTAVTGVQPNNPEGLGATSDAVEDVTGVTGDGVEAKPNAKEKHGFYVFDDWWEHRGRKCGPGVYFLSAKAAKEGAPEIPVQEWICSPVHVDAITFDQQERNFGRLLRLRNSLGNWRTWAMPMELLRGSGDELRGELLAMGVEISPQGKDHLSRYLQNEHPKLRVRCALQVGWHDGSFVLPDSVFGAKAANVTYQSGERGHDEYTQAGTLEGWQAGIAARAEGNPLLIVALSAGFAGALLQPCNAESGGLHFVGDSSTGKTTAIEAACSIWGGANYKRGWRTTANGLEAVAALFNDSLLALDEISECEPRDVGTIVYALGNGRGKQRANRFGNARSITRWRCSVLSSGERTIGTTMAEGNYRTKAGQAVRLLDVPAIRQHGAWDNLHGLDHGAAFSDALKQAATEHHGKVGRAFLERLTRDGRNFPEAFEAIKRLPQFSAQGGEGQEKRVAARFALMALAGELATEYGLTGWPEGAATKAAVEMFAAWRGFRGGSGNDEGHKICEQVADFIERNGNGRFDHVDGEQNPCRDRAGWRQTDGNGNMVFWFTTGGLHEALKGFDFKRALAVLQAAGALPPTSSGGEKAQNKRFGGMQARVYEIHADKLVRVTPATSAAPPDVTENTPQNKECTAVTPVTAPKTKACKFTQHGGSKSAKAAKTKVGKRKA